MLYDAWEIAQNVQVGTVSLVRHVWLWLLMITSNRHRDLRHHFYFYFYFFKRSTFVGSAWSFGFFIPATTANDLRLRRIFHPRCYPSHLFSYLNSWERTSISLLMLSAKQGTTGTIFITSLVWRGPCRGIESGISRTRS